MCNNKLRPLNWLCAEPHSNRAQMRFGTKLARAGRWSRFNYEPSSPRKFALTLSSEWPAGPTPARRVHDSVRVSTPRRSAERTRGTAKVAPNRSRRTPKKGCRREDAQHGSSAAAATGVDRCAHLGGECVKEALRSHRQERSRRCTRDLPVVLCFLYFFCGSNSEAVMKYRSLNETITL